jgi:hypothetical protein
VEIYDRHLGEMIKRITLPNNLWTMSSILSMQKIEIKGLKNIFILKD